MTNITIEVSFDSRSHTRSFYAEVENENGETTFSNPFKFAEWVRTLKGQCLLSVWKNEALVIDSLIVEARSVRVPQP